MAAPQEQSRSERFGRGRRVQRVATVAAILGLLVCLAIIGYAGWRYFDVRSQQPPDQLVVIGESELEAGGTVAGLVVVLEQLDGGATSVKGLDTAEPRPIPGTSFGRLRDALAVGDAKLVADLVAGKDSDSEWLLLDEDAWSSLLGRAGGAEVTIPSDTTVFTGDELFRFTEGTRTVSDAEAAALLRGSEGFAEGESGRGIRISLAEKVGSAVISIADVDDLFGAEGAEVSQRNRVEVFIARARSVQ